MVQAGGPAAINGFLFQILNHLAWFADIRIGGKIAGHGLEADAYVVLEPRDGGDARYEGVNSYVVEQYKTRPDGTWSVNAIINDVLPDLRKAVREPPGQKGAYLFVTDGRAGRLKTFDSFLTSLRSCATPADIDNIQAYQFGEGLPTTQRMLFEHIVQKSSSPTERKRSNKELTVFELLRQFEMKFEVAADDRAIDVERLLRFYTPNLGDESGIRVRLIGELMTRLAKGEVRINADGFDELLKEVGLNPERIRKLAVLSATMSKLALEESDRLKYSPAKDVRQPPSWPADKSVLVVAGRSGDGKTWQLAQLVANLGKRQEVAVLIRAATTTDGTLTRVTRLVWQDGLGETSEKSLGALTLHYKDMKPDTDLPWLTIAVDDVRDIDLLNDLISQPWSHWGMRLAVTAPRAVADGLKYETPHHVHIHQVAQFSVDEIDALLQQQGQNWADLPQDLQKLLRTPILAGLYTALSHESFQRAPHSEYEIFDRFWKRMVARTSPGDPGIVMALASRVIDDKVYPLSRTQWSEVALTLDSYTKLDTAGWLQCDAAGSALMAHDRLLNWAAAKEIVHRYLTKQWSLDQLSVFLQVCAQPQRQKNIKRLDYLPMDALWMLLNECPDQTEIVPLLEHFESEHTFGSYGEVLYRHLLPTLGTRVVPLLLARLDKLGSRDQFDYQSRLIADALTAVARQEGADLSQDAADLIGSSSESKQKIGIALLSIAPAVGLLDRLWELHLNRCEILDNGQSKWRHSDYDLSLAALRAGVRQNPDWLRNRINSTTPSTERVSELGYLLNSLAHPSASEIWIETKGVLFASMPKDQPRSLLYCIGRFEDASEIEFLIAHLDIHSDNAVGAAFSSLVKLDPDLALRYLESDSDGNFAFSRNWWLPDLLHARPEQTKHRLLDIAERATNGRLFIEQLFSGRANELDKALLEFVLHMFKTHLTENFRVASENDPIWITFPLRLFNEISRPDLLAVLVEKSKNELEHMLVQIGLSRIGRSGRMQDHILEEVRTFLILLSGNGITALVNAELQSSDFWSRHSGLKWAMINPNAETLTRLAEIARQTVPVEADGRPSSEPMQENYGAMGTLASSRADEALVDAIWSSGTPHFSIDLADLRGATLPMSKTLTARAARTLAAFNGADRRDVICALVTAWLGADPDFIAPIKTVLKHIEPSSLDAVYACVALQQLGDESNEFAQFANQLLRSEERRYAGINALISLRGKGIPHLIAYLNSAPVKVWRDLEIQVLCHLYGDETSHAFAVAAAGRYCIEHSRSSDHPLELAAEVADPQLRELILDLAFDTTSISPFRTYCAIKGLTKFDNKRAIEAVLRHLKSSAHFERELCVLLTKIAPERAALLLFDMAVGVERGSLRSAVGRALRRLAPVDVDKHLEVGFKNDNRHSRSVAVELTGWLPAERLAAQLNSLFDVETEDKVRSAIFAAHARRRNEVTVTEIFTEFKVCPTEQRWALLLLMLKVGDPVLLGDPKDSLWIGNVLSDVPYVYACHAKKELEQRIASLK